MKPHPISLILEDIRSLHNVGACFRLADGAGIAKLYLTGATGYPPMDNDKRKPWEIDTAAKGIHKTALGAEKSVDWEYRQNVTELVHELRDAKVHIAALEKTKTSQSLFSAPVPFPIALIVGHEVTGVSQNILTVIDSVYHLPMYGDKESLNVSTAAGIALYELVRKYNNE